ncbi:hypothetical protein D2Q93_13790 [Alicyclobacillaceae bacterium I2511]|nr:hypothetical protein D2Q93_13790 [Alicyclobacillaceae bacterium I2511]
MEEGELLRARLTARKMLMAGMDLKQIAEFVDLTIEEVQQIWDCKNSHCPKKRFAEQVPGLMQGYARRTPRLRSRLVHLGVEAGG